MTEPTIKIEQKAFIALCEALRAARREYRNPWPDAEQLKDTEFEHPQREAVVKALVAVMDFVRPNLPDAWMLEPLSGVMAALADIDAGRRRHPLFEPRKKVGGRRSFITDDANRAYAAAAVTLLIQGGVTEDEACRAIAPSVDMDSKQLKRWRKNIAERSATIRELYNNILGWRDEAAAWIADETERSLERVGDREAALKAGETLRLALQERVARSKLKKVL